MLEGKASKMQERYAVQAVRATIWAALNALIPLIVGLGVFVVTSRLLTPRDFGVVALATGLALIGSAACPGGFGEAIVQKLEISSRHLDTVFWLCVSSSVIIFCIECALASPLAHFFKLPIIAILIPIIGTQLIANMAAVVPNALITRSLSFHLFALRTFIVSIIAGLITLALLFEGYGLWALVISQLTASFVTMIASFLTAKWRPHFNFSLLALKELSAYGLFSSGTQNISFAFLQNEQILVGLFLGVTQLGFYNFSKRVIAVLNSVVAGSLGSVAHPVFSSIQQDRDRVRRGFLSATFISSLVSFPVFIGLMFTADRLVPLVFGQRWDTAIILVKIQCALGLVSCIGFLQAGLITSQGKANWWFYYQLLATATTILVVITFARFGLVTMMTAMVIKTYCIWLIPVESSVRLLSMSKKDYFSNFKAPLLGTILMGLAIHMERKIFCTAGNLSGLIADAACGAAVYVAVILSVEWRRLNGLLSVIAPKLGGLRRDIQKSP
jgi:teichuronic acid exporter